MTGRKKISNDLIPTATVTEGKRIKLAKGMPNNKARKLIVDLQQMTEMLTKKDIKNWREAHQMAISVQHPTRLPLYNIYTDVDIDSQVTGAIGQRKSMVKQKSFKIVDQKGNENEELTQMFEIPWFKHFVDLVLDTPYWGHSLIELGNVVDVNGKLGYDDVTLVPRRHVKPEWGMILKNPYDDVTQGYDYRNSDLANFLVEVGGPKDLGLFLKLALHTIPKKNMLAFWDQFGEIFGMPIRIGKTTSRDPKEQDKAADMLAKMGAAPWGLFNEGTEIEIKETTRGDAFNVYDKRVDKADSYISKIILNETMTIDNGSSRSQSEVHLDVFQRVVDSDADMLRDTINYKLIPLMIKHGFPISGYRFDWDESVDYTPDQQVAIEKMVMEKYDVDPKYFAEKYNIPILGPKKSEPQPPQNIKNFFD